MAKDIEVKGLIDDYSFYNGICRGGSGSDDSTWEACGARNYIMYMLNRLGVCHGKEDEAAYQNQWHSCTDGSLRSVARPNPQQETSARDTSSQIKTKPFNDWHLETGPATSAEGEDICRAVTTAQNTSIRLEVERGEGMTTIVFRKTVGNWPDLLGGFRFSLGGYGEFVFDDTLVWHTNAALLGALRAQNEAILVVPGGVRHQFSLSGSGAAIRSLSTCD